MYNGKHLISKITTEDSIRGMVFGTLGREEGSLAINYNNGGLTIKMLQRQSDLSVSNFKPGPSSK